MAHVCFMLNKLTYESVVLRIHGSPFLVEVITTEAAIDTLDNTEKISHKIPRLFKQN